MVLLTAAARAGAAAAPGGLWLDFHGGGDPIAGGTTGTKFNASATSVAQPPLAWSYMTEAGIFRSSVLADGGRVYATDAGGRAYAIDQSTGRLVWSAVFPNGTVADPALVSGLLVGCSGSDVYALNAANGSFVWSAYSGSVMAGITPWSGSVLLLAHPSATPTLMRIDLAGNLQWSYVADGGLWMSSAAAGGGLCFFGDFGSTFHAVNATTGSLAWSLSTGAAVYGAPAIESGLVYVSAHDDIVRCLNASTGQPVWSYVMFGSTHGCPAIAYGRVYVATETGLMYALDAASGSLSWSAALVSHSYCSPAAGGGFVYVPESGDGEHLVSFNAFTGTRSVVWSLSAGFLGAGFDQSSPAIVGSGVFVANDDPKHILAFGVLSATATATPTITPLPPGQIAIWPNPVSRDSDWVNVAFAPGPSANLTVYTLGGERVAEIDVPEADARRGWFRLGANRMPNGRLPRGVFLLVLRSAGRTLVARIGFL